MQDAIYIKETIGLGDLVQYSSLPENYARSTGRKLLLLSNNWIFDHNPYVTKEIKGPYRGHPLWQRLIDKEFPEARQDVYLSNAEIHAKNLGVTVYLRRPRLYRFEAFDVRCRENILLHPRGISQGAMPIKVIEHVLRKYKGCPIFQVGLEPDDSIPEVPWVGGLDAWGLAQFISQAKMLIGMSSGPAWVAACYPDVIVKVIRTPYPRLLQDRVPLSRLHSDSHWDDLGLFKMYNTTEADVGYSESYLNI